MILQQLDGADPQIELVDVVLAKVAELEVAVGVNGAVGRGERARHDFQQGRLAGPVLPDDADARLQAGVQADVGEEIVVGVGIAERHFVDLENRRVERLDLREAQRHLALFLHWLELWPARNMWLFIIVSMGLI